MASSETNIAMSRYLAVPPFAISANSSSTDCMGAASVRSSEGRALPTLTSLSEVKACSSTVRESQEALL